MIYNPFNEATPPPWILQVRAKLKLADVTTDTLCRLRIDELRRADQFDQTTRTIFLDGRPFARFALSGIGQTQHLIGPIEWFKMPWDCKLIGTGLLGINRFPGYCEVVI